LLGIGELEKVRRGMEFFSPRRGKNENPIVEGRGRA
jgi:hypothetical protein